MLVRDRLPLTSLHMLRPSLRRGLPGCSGDATGSSLVLDQVSAERGKGSEVSDIEPTISTLQRHCQTAEAAVNSHICKFEAAGSLRASSMWIRGAPCPGMLCFNNPDSERGAASTYKLVSRGQRDKPSLAGWLGIFPSLALLARTRIWPS